MNADIKTNSIWLMKGDCLERMKEIEWDNIKDNIEEYFV